MSRLGITTDGCYRTVDKTDIIEQFLCSGWTHEMYANGRDTAVRQALDVLDRVIELGLPFRNGPDGRQCFDPAEVENMISWLAVHEQNAIWETYFVATKRSGATPCSTHCWSATKASCVASCTGGGAA